jgi:Tfp pilus assembly protein FimT
MPARHRPHPRAAASAGTAAVAFSLLEMTLVVATIAILAAIAIPRYADAIHRYRVEMAAKRVVADFALARASARASGAGQVVDFSAPADGYTMAGLAAPDGRAGSYVVRLSDEPYKCTISSAAFGNVAPGTSSVRFTRYGTPEAGGSVVVSAGGYSRTVALDPVTGSAEVLK